MAVVSWAKQSENAVKATPHHIPVQSVLEISCLKIQPDSNSKLQEQKWSSGLMLFWYHWVMFGEG